MKRIQPFLAISLAAVAACTGQISTGGSSGGDNGAGNGTGTGNGGTGSNGGSGGVNMPPVMTPEQMAAGCTMDTLAKPRVWRLTTTQIKNTIMDAVGYSAPTFAMFPAEARLDGYANASDKLAIAPLDADFYFQAGDEIGAEVARRSSDFIKCDLATLAAGPCLNDFISGFGLKMWRRPLADTEVKALSDLFTKAAMQGGSPSDGLHTVVQGMFMAPDFLYRTELGSSQSGVTRLTDYELASALSYTLWETAPDATLLDLAKQGKLHDPADVTAQAKRMIAGDKAPVAMNHFMQQWLQIEDLPTAEKDTTLFTFYSPDVAADLAEETRLFLNSVMFDAGGDKSFKTLFTANYGFVNARTAPIYGKANVTSTTLTKTDLDPTQRRGLLTLAGFMAAHADPGETSLVSRGRYFREQILCNAVPPPPNANVAVFDPGKITPDMTGREKFAVHAASPQCSACHQLFDGLGFAMETYDPVGRYRTTDKGKTIDPSGDVPLPSTGQSLKFDNFVDLVDKLSATKDLYSCFSQQFLTYATGRNVDGVPACEKTLVSDQFTKSGYDMQALILAVVNSPSFIARKN